MKNTILKVLSVVLILTFALTAVFGLTGCNEEIKENIATNQADIAKNQADLEEANNAIKTANAAIAKLQADLNALSGVSATKTGLDEAIADLQAKIATNAARLETLNTELADKATEIANDLDTKAGELAEEIEAAEARVTTLVGTEKAALQAQIDVNKTAVAALQAAAEALRADVDAAATQEALDAAVAALNGVDTELQAQITANATAIADLKATAADLQDQITANATAIADLEATAADLQAQLDALEGADTELQAQITANADAITALQAADTELQAQITANADAITALGNKDTELQTAVTANADAIAALQTASATKAELETEKTALQAQITANANAIAGLVEELATLNSALTTAKAELNASIKAVSDAVDALDSTYATDAQLAAEIKALKEGEIKTLQVAVAALSAASIDGEGLVAAIDTLRAELQPLIAEFGDNYNNATDILNGETVLTSVYNEETEEYEDKWVKSDEAVDGKEYSIDAFEDLVDSKNAADYTAEVYAAYEKFVIIQRFKLNRALTEQQILDIFGALKEYQTSENMKSILDVFKDLVATVKTDGITVAEAKDNFLNTPVADEMGIDEFYTFYEIGARAGYIADEDEVKTNYEAICAARENLYLAEIDAVAAAATAEGYGLYAFDGETYTANEVLYYPGTVDVNIDNVKALYDTIKDTYFADAEMNNFYAADVMDELTGYTFSVEQQDAWDNLVTAKEALDAEIDEKFATILPESTAWPLFSDYEGIQADLAVVDTWAALYSIEDTIETPDNYELIFTASLAENGYTQDYAFVKQMVEYAFKMSKIYENYVLNVTFGEGEDAKNLAEQAAIELEGGAEKVLFVRLGILHDVDDAILALRDQITAVDGYSPYHEEVIQIEKDEYDELYAAIEWPAGLKYLQVDDKGTAETEDDEYFKVVRVIDDNNFDTMLGMDKDKWAIYDDICAKVGTLEKAKYGDLGALEDLYIKGIDGLTEVLAAKIGDVSYSDGAKITTGYQADLNAIFEYHGIMYAEESEEDINYVNYVAMTTDFRTNLATLKNEYDHLTDKVQAVYDEVAAIVKNAGTDVLTDLQKILWANKKVNALTGVDTPDFQLKEVVIDEYGQVKKDAQGNTVYAKDASDEQVYIPYTDFANQLTAKLLKLVALAEEAESIPVNALVNALGEYDLNKTEQYKDAFEAVVYWVEKYLGINIDEYFGEEYDPAHGDGAPAIVENPGELKEREDEDDPTWDAIVLDYNAAVAAYETYVLNLADYTAIVYRPDYIYNNIADYLPGLLDAAKVYFIDADEKGDNQGILNVTNYKYKNYKYIFIDDFANAIDAADEMIEIFAAADTEWKAILDDVAALPALGGIHIHDVEIADASDRYAAYVEAYYDGAIVNEQFDESTTYTELSDKQAELDLKIDEAATLYEDILREAQEAMEVAADVPAEGDVATILAKVDDLLFHISQYREFYCDGKHELCEKQCTLIGIAQYVLPYDLEYEKAALEDYYGVDDLSDDAEPKEEDYGGDAVAFSTDWTAWNNANTAYKNRVAENEFVAGINEELVAAGDIDAELIAYQAKAKALAVKVFADGKNKNEITYLGQHYVLAGDGDKDTLKTTICDKIDARTALTIPEDDDRPATTAEKIKAVKDDYNLFLGLLLDVDGGADPADYAIDPILVP